ncbi:LysR substrate-binding domain-containing protein [Ottowia thiooxydans]|uniref:LysR family glycine cleavage system transcriptional activator n=1 Tax=Ottowia thiooxydans TaxID=219182 RepID=A0ABV2Q3T6_9BURK
MLDVSLASLRAFRAVARCGSFTAASRDLGCAQSAISRQVAALEKHTGKVLVLRGHRNAQLTPAGEIYLETVTRALDELDHGAIRMADAGGARATVKILAMPSFAARWLIPRLHKLRSARIDVDIELATSIWDADFLKERFDIAVHYGDGSMPGSRLLMHDCLVPVASPSLLRGEQPGKVTDLARHPWLHDSLRASKWQHWLAACGEDELASVRNMRLQDTESTLAAAVAGLGIAMGHLVLIEHDVSEGRLVEAWPSYAPISAGYHLLQTKRVLRNPSARAVGEWLLKEASAFRDAMPSA